MVGFLAGLLLLVIAVGCGGTSSDARGGRLSLVAYSTPQEAYEQVIAAFQATGAGGGVQVEQSFGASGEQARAVIAGLPADVVALSLAPDVEKLVEAGEVARGWAAGPSKGMVTHSVVVLAVRKGNPKNIRTWADVVEPGVQVLTPNPQTSGGAKWNVMAAYGANSVAGKAQPQGEAFLKALFGNVVVQDKSAREALQTFESGKGDVLLAYENEALTAQKKGLELDYVIPDQTIRIENPIAVTATAKNRVAAEALVAFALGEQAQMVFAHNGYRPVDPKLVDARRFPTPAGLFTIEDLGGWSKVDGEFFDEKDGIVTEIQREAGG